MKLGGIISGAIGGGAQAFGQIADNNIRAQAEEERFARERAARDQELATQRQWRREDAIWEMDSRLQRIAGEVKAKTQAGIEAQGMVNDQRNKVRSGIIEAEMNKRFDIRNPEAMTPGERAAIEQAKRDERGALERDPAVNREVGLQMGEISSKDILTDDINRERAANQASRDQMKMELEDRKEEGRNQRSDERIKAMLEAAGIRGEGKGNQTDAEKLSTVISTHRQIITANEDKLKRAKLIDPNGAETKALEADIAASRGVIRQATAMQQESLGASPGSSSGGAQPQPKPSTTSTDSAPVKDERVRIILNEYKAAVGRGDKDVAEGTARELKRLGYDVTGDGMAKPQGGVPMKSSGVQLINSKADYDKLPSGARFKAPDGTTRIKP